MKIGLLHDSALPPRTYGGIERIMVSLAEEYRGLGHEVVVISKKGSQVPGVENIPIPDVLSAANLARVLPPDLTFLHAHQPLPEKPKVPFLVTIHGNGHPEEQYFKNTNFLSQSHARNHNAKYYIYNGVDPKKYPYVEAKADHFVFLARTTWRVKNVKTAIRWAKDLGVRLEIIGGTGWSRNGIHYKGLLEEPEKIKILSTARALIYPTNWDEPCAAAPLEALACGTPVISSTNGCMPELVRPGTGLVCGDYDKLLAAVSSIDQMKPAECRQAVETFFSVSRMAQDYINIFQLVLEKGELDHQPRYNFGDSVRLLYKPTLWNQLNVAFRGKI